MIQSEALSRTRAILNETTAGFYSDTELYQFLDSGLNDVVSYAISQLDIMRMQMRYKPSLILEPLLTTVSAANGESTTVDIQEYNLPSNYLYTDNCKYTSNDTTNPTPVAAVYVPHSNGVWYTKNSYLAYTIDDPAYYIRDGKIGFFPIPSHGGAGCYYHYYYKKPTAITVSTASSEIPTKVISHEAVINYAVFYALTKDARFQEATVYLNLAKEILKPLY